MVTLLNEIINELTHLRDRTHFDGEAAGIETAIALIEDYRDAYITALDRDLDRGGNIGVIADGTGSAVLNVKDENE